MCVQGVQHDGRVYACGEMMTPTGGVSVSHSYREGDLESTLSGTHKTPVMVQQQPHRHPCRHHRYRDILKGSWVRNHDSLFVGQAGRTEPSKKKKKGPFLFAAHSLCTVPGMDLANIDQDAVTLRHHFLWVGSHAVLTTRGPQPRELCCEYLAYAGVALPLSLPPCPSLSLPPLLWLWQQGEEK